MREFIADRLSGMHSVEQRAILKEALNNVFLPLYDETERKYAALEQRVRDELPLVYDVYTVYGTVLPREQVDSKHAYLSPVLPEEAEEKILSAEELVEAMRSTQKPIAETVFCKADYLQCQRIEKDKRILNGAFRVGSERYPFKFRLKQSTRYMEQVQALHTAFLHNAVPWTTINGAYLSKFFDVCLTEPTNIPLGTKISPEQIEISFGPYEDIMQRGLIPVWNIDKYRVKGDDFPMPALDAVNYEYRFELDKLGKGNGFLVDYNNAFILDVRREEQALVVTSTQKKGLRWDMYRLRRRQDSAVESYPYPVLSNARRDSFSTRLMSGYSTHIATRGEMRKLLTSFEVSEYVTLADFHFAGGNLSGDTYDMNPFIRDEIRDPACQKTLALSFKARNRELFINRDIISFLVSEFQAAYPEYRCVGTLL